jgi:hypothetical protein
LAKNANGLAVVEMTGPDARMDQFGNSDAPANPLPVKCPHCTMPDIDFAAKPYLLAKGFAAPAEHAPAEVGNFLVRERARKILELVVPGQVTFHPTAEKNSKKPTPWFLAVSKGMVNLPGYKDTDEKRQRCRRCGEPKLGYRSDDSYASVKKRSFTDDIFKAQQWYAQLTEEDSIATANMWRKKYGEKEMIEFSDYGLTPPEHPQRWTRRQLDRDLFFSVRLEQLFKKAKLKGQLVRYVGFDDVEMSDADRAWVEEKIALLAKHGLVDGDGAGAMTTKKKQTTSSASKWFAQYLKKNAAKKKPAKIDFPAIEKKRKLTLPQDYKDFISTVGPKSFEDVMQQEGFAANVLAPGKLDFRSYRRGKMKDLLFDEDSLAIDGVMFADTDHGDAFVFDISQKDAAGNYPIYWYDHESNAMEPFAPTFAGAIKRFTTKT